MDCLGSFAYLDDKELFVLLDEEGAIDPNILHIEARFSRGRSGSRQKFVLTVVADGRLQRSVCLPGIRPAVRLRRTWFQFSASRSGTFVFVFTRLF